MPVNTFEDLTRLIELVGPAGARAALRADKTTLLDSLLSLVDKSGGTRPRRPTRQEVIELVIGPYEHTIDRTLAELSAMAPAELEGYLRKARCSRGELMAFLDRAKLPYSGGATLRELIKEATAGISRLGMYQRIAGGA